jgi:plastocyanin
MIQNFTFVPPTLTVSKGTKVTWTNTDTTAHTVVGDTGGVPMPSGDIPPGGTSSYVFDVDGSFTYHCGIHPSMTGTVTVTP